MKAFSVVAAFAALCGVAQAVEYPVSVTGRVYLDTNCNGRIDSNDKLLDGVSISLQSNSGQVLGIAQTGEFGLPGVYAFPSDLAPISPMSGTQYVLQLLLPSGFVGRQARAGQYAVVRNSYTQVFALPSGSQGTFGSYDFLITQYSSFAGFDQDDWGASFSGHCYAYRGCGSWCHRCTPSWFGFYHWRSYEQGVAALLNQNFTSVYGSGGIVVGGDNTLTLTSPAAVARFLPQAPPPVTLTSSLINPTSPAGSLAGELVALKLNVDFSDAGITTGLFGSLKVTSGPLAGYKVRDVLAIANLVYGGNLFALPAGVTVGSLTSTMACINGNFDLDDRDNDRGYLAL